MGTRIKFIGILGLVILVFGVLIFGLFSQLKPEDLYYLTEVHLIIGVVLLALFLLRGGVQIIGAAAARRAVGFGAGVIIYSVLFVGLLGVANYFILRHDPLQYDSTEQKVYTLAPQTKQVLASLKEPVLIRAFYVGGEVDDKVRDLLNRISRESDKISWQAVDPEKSPAITEKFGINEKGTLHFSFAGGDSTKQAKAIREIGEQEIVNALLRLTRSTERTVYYSCGHGETDLLDGTTNTGGLFLREAIQGESIKVKKLVLGDEKSVPDDASVLLVMAPRRPFLEGEREAVMRYLSKGGNAVFLNEPNATGDIAELAKPLGIIVGNDVIIEKSVQLFAGPSYDAQSVVTIYPPHAITKDFKQGTIFPTSTSVRRAEKIPADASVAEIAKTGKESWAEKKVSLVFSNEPQAALEDEDIKGPVSIAAAFEGVVRAQGDRAVKDDTQKKSRVVVFGDADFVTNVNIRQLFNRDLFLNALNWVLGDEEGVTIRAKTLRRSTRALSDKQFRLIFVATGVIIPELLVLLGFAVWWRRTSAVSR
jgi:hypothetical protein